MVASQKLGAFLIKPDAADLHLTEQIIADITTCGFDILFRGDMRLTEDQISRLYPQYVGKYEYPSMVKLLKSGCSTLVIVSPISDCCGIDIFQQIKESKGKARQGGIRDKYIMKYREDFEASGLYGRQLMDELARNRIHTPDNQQELDVLFDLFISPQDLVAIGEGNPRLYSELSRRFAIVPLSKERI